jgi:hypothetical protein
LAEYEESMFLIVTDSFSLSSQVLTEAELMKKAKDWARMLFKIIPENKLQDCFEKAREERSSPFAISGYELEQAYVQIQKENYKPFYVTPEILEQMEKIESEKIIQRQKERENGSK